MSLCQTPRLDLQTVEVSRSVSTLGKAVSDNQYCLTKAVITKYRRLGDLNKKSFFWSQFWRLWVSDECVNCVGFWGHSPWHRNGCFLTVFFTWSSLWMCLSPNFLYLSKHQLQHFPGGPVVKIPNFQCRGHGFNPWLGNEDPPCFKV